MYVEDKVSHRGPFPIEVTADQTVAELKAQIEKEFEIPADYQKWILGKELVTNENSTLKDYNITTEGCPVFLYLVAPGNEKYIFVKISLIRNMTRYVHVNEFLRLKVFLFCIRS